MLADAFFAESYKFLRMRSTLFWGFGAAPLGYLLFNLALDTWLSLRLHMPAEGETGRAMVQALGLGGNAFFQIFFAAGASSLFAGEYRWETWRLLTPRNSRLNLLLAKFLVYAVASAATLVALAAAAVIHTVYAALLFGHMPTLGAGFAAPVAGVFLASWADVLVLGAFVAIIAIASRAANGALMAGICFAFAQGIAMALVHPWDAPLRWYAALPGMDAYLLRAWASGDAIAPGIFADPARVLPAALILLAWIVLLTGAALVRFQRQDLPRD